MDEHTRRSLAMHAGWSIRAVDVITVVEAAFAQYGRPRHLSNAGGVCAKRERCWTPVGLRPPSVPAAAGRPTSIIPVSIMVHFLAALHTTTTQWNCLTHYWHTGQTGNVICPEIVDFILGDEERDDVGIFRDVVLSMTGSRLSQIGNRIEVWNTAKDRKALTFTITRTHSDPKQQACKIEGRVYVRP